MCRGALPPHPRPRDTNPLGIPFQKAASPYIGAGCFLYREVRRDNIPPAEFEAEPNYKSIGDTIPPPVTVLRSGVQQEGLKLDAFERGGDGLRRLRKIRDQ